MTLFPLFLLVWMLAGQVNSSTPAIKTLEQVFNQAMQDMNAGLYPEAETEFRGILGKDPSNAAVLINLGVLYSKTRRFTEAIDSYKKALRVAPREEAVQMNLGLAYLKQDDYADALPYFVRLHAAHPDAAQVTTLLATCLTYTGDASSAIDVLAPLTGLASEDRGALYILGVAYTRGDKPEKARETLSRVFAGAPAAQAAFLFGEAYLEATDYPDAVQSFETSLQNDPHMAGAHRELGRAYLGMHQNERAEEELRLAIAADPGDGSALYSLGALLVQLSRWKDGRTVLERAQVAAPESWATAFYLGKAEFEMHDVGAAEKQLRRAAELNPDEPGAPYLLARILRAAGHTEEATRYMDRVVALHATALDAERRAMESADKGKHAVPQLGP